jgi:glycosyltransferase involved in cell wall biosynthesis
MCLSVIVPVGYDPDGLEITLKSLMARNEEFNIDVIVINDGGDKGVSSVCKKYYAREVSLKNNVGPAEGRNIGVKEAKYNSIAFLDADVVVCEFWAKHMYDALKINDYVAGNVVINRALIKNFFHEYDFHTAFNVETYMKSGHGATANLGVKKHVFDKIGLFNKTLRSGEDTEFGDRVFKTGEFKMAYEESVVVLHPPRSFKAQWVKRKRVVTGHLNLSGLYADRYSKYRKTYTNPWVMLRPPLKFVRSNNYRGNKIPKVKLVGFFLYAYALKIYSFYSAISYILKPSKVGLELKKESKSE